MKLAEAAAHPAVRWTALVALLVGISQFNTGLKIVYSKWMADEAAADAKKVAVEAKGTAESVDDRFNRYMDKQQQAIETQNKVAEAISNYAAQQQQTSQQQALNIPGPYQSLAGLEEWENGVCWRCPYLDRQRCFDQDLWQMCQ